MKILNNPLMKLPAAAKAVAFLAAHPALAAVFRELLGELRKECHRLANHSWAQRKGPMAAYWMAAGAYVGHTMRLIRPGTQATAVVLPGHVLDAMRDASRALQEEVQAADLEHPTIQRHQQVADRLNAILCAAGR